MPDELAQLDCTFVPYQSEVRSKRRAPFAGVDGEGGDFYGNDGHEYLLLRAGNHVLETGKPLTALECLEFLATLPKGYVYVSFFFNYDVTMMLRSLPPERLERLLNPDLRRKTPCSPAYPVDYGPYQIDYMPNKEFRVRLRKVKEPWTIINDTGAFFQETFVSALHKWFADEPELAPIIARIAEMKGKRSTFGPMTDEERIYNRQECELLARMMEKYREMCDRLDLRPNKWQGPGQLVTAFFKREKFPRQTELEIYEQSPDFIVFANNAFYGGRFEACLFGWIPSTVYQWDINSAYASVYHKLPCLRHSRWQRVKRLPAPNSCIFVADISFKHPCGWSVNTLPIRTNKGTLVFPRQGRGIYWSPEIDAARTLSVEIKLEGECWVCVTQCDCEPFKRVNELYQERQRLGSSTQGRPLKLMLATLYGKFAQTVGCAPYASPIWAGLITSYTRAMLVEASHATGNGGADVVMLATDGLFTLEDRPTLPLSKTIGDWSKEDHANMLTVQSGVYVLPKMLKTRGVTKSKIEEYNIDLLAVWFKWLDNPDFAQGPTVCIPLHQFIGLRLAVARNKPETAGLWVDVPKQITYDWESKRTAKRVDGTMLRTMPIQGSPGFVSVKYDRMIGGERAQERLLHDDQPDWAEKL